MYLIIFIISLLVVTGFLFVIFSGSFGMARANFRIRIKGWRNERKLRKGEFVEESNNQNSEDAEILKAEKEESDKRFQEANLLKKQNEEERQKFLELRSKVIQLKNLVLDKVENLQSSVMVETDIDFMDGLDFEHYVADLLNNRGFHAEVTKGSGDLGVDIIATNYIGKYAIQVKRYNQPVSRRAVSDAVAGKSYYDCDSAMVITSNYFTNDAVKLADANDCLLVDRDELIEWITDFTDASKSYEQLLAHEIENLQESDYFWGEEIVFEASKELIFEYNIKLSGEKYKKYYVADKNTFRKLDQPINKSQVETSIGI